MALRGRCDLVHQLLSGLRQSHLNAEREGGREGERERMCVYEREGEGEGDRERRERKRERERERERETWRTSA
jgi:hypothetical protein